MCSASAQLIICDWLVIGIHLIIRSAREALYPPENVSAVVLTAGAYVSLVFLPGQSRVQQLISPFSKDVTVFLCESTKQREEKQSNQKLTQFSMWAWHWLWFNQGKQRWTLTTNEHSCTVNVLVSWCYCKIYLRCTYIQIQINHIIYKCKMSLYVKTQSI